MVFWFKVAFAFFFFFNFINFVALLIVLITSKLELHRRTKEFRYIDVYFIIQSMKIYTDVFAQIKEDYGFLFIYVLGWYKCLLFPSIIFALIISIWAPENETSYSLQYAYLFSLLIW